MLECHPKPQIPGALRSADYGRKGMFQRVAAVVRATMGVHPVERLQYHLHSGVPHDMQTHPPAKTVRLLHEGLPVLLCQKGKATKLGVVGIGLPKIAAFHTAIEEYLQAPDVQPLVAKATDRGQPLY